MSDLKDTDVKKKYTLWLLQKISKEYIDMKKFFVICSEYNSFILDNYTITKYLIDNKMSQFYFKLETMYNLEMKLK